MTPQHECCYQANRPYACCSRAGAKYPLGSDATSSCRRIHSVTRLGDRGHGSRWAAALWESCTHALHGGPGSALWLEPKVPGCWMPDCWVPAALEDTLAEMMSTVTLVLRTDSFIGQVDLEGVSQNARLIHLPEVSPLECATGRLTKAVAANTLAEVNPLSLAGSVAFVTNVKSHRCPCR